jgi:hypothetical protein
MAYLETQADTFVVYAEERSGTSKAKPAVNALN